MVEEVSIVVSRIWNFFLEVVSCIFLTLASGYICICVATKFAVDAITKALSIELVETPIRVSQICPGLVNTEFSTIRFRGDKEKADNVYKGLQPLVAEDIGKFVWRERL